MTGDASAEPTGLSIFFPACKVQDAGFRVAEVPVHHFHRAYGKSQFFNFRRLARTGVDVFKLWYALVIRRAHDPARARRGRIGGSAL